MVTFNSLLKPHMNESELLSMVAQSSEFESMMVREVRTRLCVWGAVRVFGVRDLWSAFRGQLSEVRYLGIVQ